MEKLVYSVKETSKIINLGITKTYDLVNNNSIPNFRVGKKILIPKVTLEQWLYQAISKKF
jgi:excisionase family DNA binding protein